MIRDDREGRPTTTSSTGRPATRPRPTAASRAPTSSSSRTWSSRARTRRRWRPAARSPTTTAVSGKLTVWCTTQAPHAHRTLYTLVTGLPEHKIRVISPDVGGGFGNKVPVYPGYVCAIVGAIVTGRPVKWMEDRSENLMSTGFARDYAMRGAIAATREGKLLALARRRLADHGAFNAAAQPSALPGRASSASSPAPTTSRRRTAASPASYTNKAPGGVAYSCSFRIAEAVYLVERIVDCLARELGVDPVELRLAQPAARPSSSRTRRKTGWVYDSGDYERALRKALDIAGLRRAAPRAGARSASAAS